MGTRFYTTFRVRTDHPGVADEYSGVIEVRKHGEEVLEPREIEQMLARNFSRDVHDVEVLTWARLH